jgi:hypothetical protein
MSVGGSALAAFPLDLFKLRRVVRMKIPREYIQRDSSKFAHWIVSSASFRGLASQILGEENKKQEPKPWLTRTPRQTISHNPTDSTIANEHVRRDSGISHDVIRIRRGNRAAGPKRQGSYPLCACNSRGEPAARLTLLNSLARRIEAAYGSTVLEGERSKNFGPCS